jgi:hypothetical protein
VCSVERIDYFDALGEGWRITWRYKILWLLGLLYAGFGGSGTRREVSEEAAQESWRQTTEWISANAGLAIGIGLVGLLVIIALVIISVSAQGGLVWAANEAAAGRKPAFGPAFRAGFRRAGRTFMIGLVPGLIMLALSIGYLMALLAAGAGSLFIALAYGDMAAVESVVPAALGGMLAIGIGGAIVLLVVAFIVWMTMELAVRYGMLADYTFGRALGRAWHDVWGRRGAVTFMWVSLLAALVVGIGLSIAGAPFPAREAGDPMGLWELIAGVISVISATWISASWTVFFRRMTGMERWQAPETYAQAAPLASPAGPTDPSGG